MKNSDTPAMPQDGDLFCDRIGICPTLGAGLTKREIVLKDFMCSLIASNDITSIVDQVSEDYARLAGDLADAYFRELEK